MPMTPLDVQNRQFRRVFRGYSGEDVDEFLHRLGRDYEIIYRENAELRQRLERLQEELARYRDLEGTLKEALVVAQQAAGEVRENAAREAELIRREAEMTAQERLAEAQARVAEAQRRYEELHRAALVFRGRMRSFLLSQLEMLGEEEEENAAGRGLREAAAGREGEEA